MRLTGSQWRASARGSDITCVDFTFVTRCDCLYLLSILSIVLISVTSVYARIMMNFLYKYAQFCENDFQKEKNIDRK